MAGMLFAFKIRKQFSGRADSGYSLIEMFGQVSLEGKTERRQKKRSRHSRLREIMRLKPAGPKKRNPDVSFRSMKFSSLRIKALRVIDLRLWIRILAEACIFHESLSLFLSLLCL